MVMISGYNPTNLPNTTYLEQALEESTAYTYLIVVDIVKLKQINKIYGRDSADTLLNEIADYIMSLKIPDSTLYRVNMGDFGLLTSCPDNALILSLAQKMRDRLHREWTIYSGNHRQMIFASCDICVIPLKKYPYASFVELQSMIEHARSMAQTHGRVAVYDDKLDSVYRHKKALEYALKQAVDEGMEDFHLQYQPLLEPGIGKWSGLEALCRWDSAEFGEILPEKFLPVAESCGLISEIGLWVLEQAIVQVKEWGLDKTDRFLLCLHLSPLQFNTPHFELIVEDILQRHNYPPQKLCLEVMEAGRIGISEYAVSVMQSLCKLGILLALDDFGIGFSTLDLLHKLPVKLLTTDKSFLDNVGQENKAKSLFNAIITLAHNTNIRVIAKGVETEDQAGFLIKQGADYLMGPYFSPIMKPELLEEEFHNFSSPCPDLVALGYGKIDITAPHNLPKFELKPSQYRVLYDCVHEVFSSPSHDKAIESALARIGGFLGVSRAYVFQQEEEGLYSNTHEWCGEGIMATKKQLQRLALRELYPEWMNTLIHDGLLVATDIHDLRGKAYAKDDYNRGLSMVVFPLWKDKVLHGFVGLDDCEKPRIWSPEEVQMLHTLSGIITSSLGKMWLQEKVNAQNKRREMVLNSLDIAIHVTDLDTNEILFANSGLAKLYGDDHIAGRKCWEILENRTEPCPFCPRNELMRKPGDIYQWDHYCGAVGRHLRIRGAIIPWTDDKLAHLEYAEDITELRDSQKQLELLASTDMQTNCLNRHAFLPALRSMLESAQDCGTPVTLVFIDMDGLKKVNDTYGHAAGDELIDRVVTALKENIRDSDILGRFGGDEFVIAFNNCLKGCADKRMIKVLQALKGGVDESRSYGFSYGLAETTEILGPATEEYAAALIELADERMFEQKRSKQGKK